MRYTVRYAHLEASSPMYVGESVHRGMYLGTMGNTGQSTGAHLHIDCIVGERNTVWRLSDAEDGLVQPAHRQIHYFIDQELSGGHAIRVTTDYNDREYFKEYGLVHLGYDLVIDAKKPNIYWNRSSEGIVVGKGYDSGYGNYLLISFSA